MQCEVRGVKVYYETAGEGRPFLMIHGWGPDHRLMKGCMEPVFQDSGGAWKRIYFDLPGMGKTKGEPSVSGSDGMLDVVLGFIDAVIGGERFVLAGESYGGYLARGVVHERAAQTDGLLLICPAAMRGDENEEAVPFRVLEQDDALLESLSEEERELFMLDGVCTVRNRRVWERYRREVAPGLRVTDNAFLSERVAPRNRFRFDADEPEPKFLRPTLILTGRQDTMVGYRGIWQIIGKYPRASFLLLDRAGHALQIEQDALFTAAVREWLERVEGRELHA